MDSSQLSSDPALTTRRLVLLLLYYLGAMLLLHVSWQSGCVGLCAGLILFWRTLTALVRRYLVDSWRLINAGIPPLARVPIDYRPPVVFATCGMVLTLLEYFGGVETFGEFVTRFDVQLFAQRYIKLWGLAYWVVFRLVLYIGVPTIVLFLFPSSFSSDERLRSYGLSMRRLKQHLRLYALLYLVVLPPLLVASTTRPFRRMYPFYKLAGRSWGDLLAWETLYAAQFVALELFFRGFMLYPLKPALGAYSIFAAAVPYGMIHYGKPIVEVVGSFAAGTALGTLSLRSGSIWPGVLLHATVAITMDVLAVFQAVGYPGNPQFVG